MQESSYHQQLPDTDEKITTKKVKPDRVTRYFFTGLVVLTFFLLGSFLVVALATFFTGTDLRQQAAVNPAVIIRYSPATLTVTTGQEFTVPVELVTGGKSIAVAEVLPTFDKTFFQPISLTASTFLSSTLVPATVTTTGGFTSLLVAKPIAIPPTAATGQGQIALVKLKALKAGTSTVAFDQTRTRAPEFKGAPENIVGTYGPLAVTVTTSTTPTPTPTTTPTPGPESNRAKVTRLGNTAMSIRTTFTAKAGLNPADNTQWPQVALFTNNGTGYDGPFDYGSCATQLYGCGTPNKYLDKLIATIDVNNTSLVTTTPTTLSKLITFPTENETTAMVSKLSYAFFNDYWNPSTNPVTDRDVAITKVEILGPTGQVIETYTPTALSYLDDTSPTAVITNRFYFDKGIINPAGTVDSSQDGMKKAFDKVELETIVQNNSRANGAWKMTTEASFNVVSTSLGQKLLTVAEQSNPPTPPPTTPPTTPPSPQPPTTASASLQLQFRLGGLKKAGIQIPADVTVRYAASGSAAVTKVYNKTYTSIDGGTLASTTPLQLEGITVTTPITNVEVFVKTPTSLQKKIGTLTLNKGANQLLTTAELFVGDFNQDAGQKNVFNILDVSKMLTEYKALNNPITDANRAYDVNFDNNFNILDASYVIQNYQTLVLQGEQP